jgi:5-methylcytosine-specific restriction endonuclease McrA
MSSRILTLDSQGQPNRWVSHETAIIYHAKNLVAWQLGEGENDVLYRGGDNRMTGLQSRIITAPIIAVKGLAAAHKKMRKAPSLTNRELFRRDRHMCAYCGRTYNDMRLTRDHIIPTSRKGLDTWTNVVTACDACNHRKDDMLLEEAGMQLLYVPYTPNRAEALILENRNVLACQMDYLLAFIPEHSRVRETISSIH